MKNRAIISVVIPSLHRPDLTAKCIESVRKQNSLQGQLEIFVVENAARPGLIYEIPASSRDIHSLLLKQNLGTTGSLNHALRQVGSPYVLLLNNDVELGPCFLEGLRQALDQNPKAAFATGKLLDGKRDTHLDGAGDAILMGGGAYRLGHGDADAGQFSEPASVIAGCGAATLFRCTVIEQLGGLDEQLFAYLDDVDLGLHAHLRGYSGLYVPEAVASHLGSATLGNVVHPRILAWITRNQLLVLLKNYPGVALLRLLPRILLYQLLWAFKMVRGGAIRPYVRGLIEWLLGFPRAFKERRHRQKNRQLRGEDFLQLLRASERQIYHWHMAHPREQRSRLLNVYFGVFGAP